jgi:hypothetical protein
MEEGQEVKLPGQLGQGRRGLRVPGNPGLDKHEW